VIERITCFRKCRHLSAWNGIAAIASEVAVAAVFAQSAKALEH